MTNKIIFMLGEVFMYVFTVKILCEFDVFVLDRMISLQ